MHRVWLHGFAGTPSYFRRLVADAETTFREHYWWLPGHGSAEDVFDFTSAVAQLNRRIEQLDAEVDVVGYSMGARLAAALAVDGPSCIRQVIAISAHPGFMSSSHRQEREHWERQWHRRWRDCMTPQAFEAAMQQWSAQPLLCSKASSSLQDALWQDKLVHTPRRLATAFWAMRSSAMAPLLGGHRFPRCPIRWVSGAEDTKYHRLALALKAELEPMTSQVAFQSVVGAGHNVAVDNHDWFLSDVVRGG